MQRDQQSVQRGLGTAFAPGQLWFADNYFEAVGLLAALKAGLHPASVDRPLKRVPVLPV